MLLCGYCLGEAVWSGESLTYVHATAGDRVDASSPGDFVSARHNRAGTTVLAVDVIDDTDEPVTD